MGHSASKIGREKPLAVPRWLTTTQAASGTLFLLFVSIHLINTFLAAIGREWYDGFQQAARVVYQYPGIEILFVFGPLLVHAGAGLYRLIRYRTPARSLSWPRRLHRYAGVVLLIFIFGHALAVRGASLWAGVYPGFEGIAFTFDWMPYYFYPYYFLFALAAAYHGWYGAHRIVSMVAAGRAQRALRSRVFWALPAGAAVVILAALLGFEGLWYDVGEPAESEYARLVIRVFGLEDDD